MSKSMKEFKQRMKENKNIMILADNNREYEVQAVKPIKNKRELLDNLHDLVETGVSVGRKVDLSNYCDSFFTIQYEGNKRITRDNNIIIREKFKVFC